MFLRQLLALMAACAMFLQLSGCAAQPISRGDGVIAQSATGVVYTFDGRSGSDSIAGLKFKIPPACAGRVVSLSAEYRTVGIGDGRQSYHGIHFDYEVFAKGQAPAYPADWREDPSSDWTPVNRSWAIPADMSFGVIRIGLQGVPGSLHVRNIRIAGC